MSLEELLKACAENGSAADWEEFVRRFHTIIAAVALRTAQRWGNAPSSLVDDLIQETYLKICRHRTRLLSEFTPHHPEAFYGYLKVVTANVVHDHFRAERSQKRGSGRPEESVDEVPVAACYAMTSSTENAERDILLKEVDTALCSSLAGKERMRDRAIFWLYYRYGLSALEIAFLPSISLTVKGVESVIHRLTQLVREQLITRKPGVVPEAEGTPPEKPL
jgi:RNA polymerase sigma-70 factor, ECF subfamily